MSDNLPEKKRGRPPKPATKTSKKDMAENAKFWLSLATLRTNPFTKQKQLLSQLDILNIKMINKAKAGNVNAYNAIMDRAFGKPKQYSEVDINQRITIAAFEWAEDKPPKMMTEVPKPDFEEASYEEEEAPDPEVEDFKKESDQAE